MAEGQTTPAANVIHLHDRLKITLSPKATRLIREEIARQIREGQPVQTVGEIVEDAVTFHCEALATKWNEAHR
jgi:hypothetical protein